MPSNADSVLNTIKDIHNQAMRRPKTQQSKVRAKNLKTIQMDLPSIGSRPRILNFEKPGNGAPSNAGASRPKICGGTTSLESGA